MRFKITTQRLSAIAVVIVVGLVISSGFVGLFSLNQTRLNTQLHIEAIDMARSAQIELEKQYNFWKSMIYERDNFESYQKNFLNYSRHMVKVQDYLSNIKIIYRTNNKIYSRLDDFAEIHGKINQEYISKMVLLEFADRKERDRVVAALHDSGQNVIMKMETIVEEIRNNSAAEIQQINNHYFRIMLVSIIVLITVTLGMGIWIARQIVKSHSILSGLVEEKTRDLVSAHRVMTASEAKYRLLVEGTAEIVFTLDKNMVFLNSNKAIKQYLKYSPSEIKGMNFLDMIYVDNGNDLSKRLIHEKITQVVQSKQPVVFNAIFKSPRNIESKEMKVRLEYLEAGDGIEIIGRVEDIADDAIARSNTFEHSIYEIENYLLLAEDISVRLSHALNNHMPKTDVGVIRIALREILINAIEHGNLGISFEEKTNALLTDNYFQLIEKRRRDPRFKSRKVHIEYIIDKNKAVYKITDQGDGFDVAKHVTRKELINEQLESHGRGIFMTQSVFDEVTYNSKGNQVLLVKRLNAIA